MHQARHRRDRRAYGEREPATWGYTRIRGGLQSLGHDVARHTINAILTDHGMEPAPERGTKTPWKTCLAAHWDGLAAADVFSVEVLTMGASSATSSSSSGGSRPGP